MVLLIRSNPYSESSTLPPDRNHWKVGEPKPRLTYSEIQEVIFVSADGDELDYVKSTFTHLPGRLHSTFLLWTGDDARFITANL